MEWDGLMGEQVSVMMAVSVARSRHFSVTYRAWQWASGAVEGQVGVKLVRCWGGAAWWGGMLWRKESEKSEGTCQ